MIQQYAHSTYNGTIIVMVEELCRLLKHLSEETKVCNCKPEVSELEKSKAEVLVEAKPKPKVKAKKPKAKKDGI